MKIKTIFKIVGYEMETPDGNFMKSCIFWIYSDNAKDALKKAKSKGIEKKFFTIIEVIEK